jgi:hypothetical protein
VRLKISCFIVLPFVLTDRRHADDTPATIELLETIDDDLDKVEAHLVKTSDLSASEEYGLLESIPDIVFFENGIPSLYNGKKIIFINLE